MMAILRISMEPTITSNRLRNCALQYYSSPAWARQRGERLFRASPEMADHFGGRTGYRGRPGRVRDIAPHGSDRTENPAGIEVAGRRSCRRRAQPWPPRSNGYAPGVTNNRGLSRCGSKAATIAMLAHPVSSAASKIVGFRKASRSPPRWRRGCRHGAGPRGRGNSGAVGGRRRNGSLQAQADPAVRPHGQAVPPCGRPSLARGRIEEIALHISHLGRPR